ncbi:MAG: methylmalonyl-CoA mutase family protein, partial [Sediminibacterium sp.]
AGSYYVESLTQEVERKAWELIHKMDAMGGSVAAIEEGFMQDEIARSAYEYQRNIENGEKIIVGVNKFTVEKEEPVPGFKIDDSIRTIQSQKLATLRAERNQAAAEEALLAIKKAATTGENLMPPVIAAVENYCSLGEIADTLRSVFGEYK